MYSREEIVKEATEYFYRNVYDKKEKQSLGIDKFCTFFDESRTTIKINNMLEIGCSSGFNLRYMNSRYGIKCYGVEPSDKAIDYGNKLSKKWGFDVVLRQGFSDEIPFETGMFDFVYIGFCLYQVSRDCVLKSLAEITRVMKMGGSYLCITDFDTPTKYQRRNVHNEIIHTYKEDYAECVKPFGFTLIYKTTYSHALAGFDPTIQERLSTQVFYREMIDNIYIKDDI